MRPSADGIKLPLAANQGVNQPKVLILQRSIPTYRKGLFRALTRSEQFDVALAIGTDAAEAKAKNAKDLSDIRHTQLNTRCVKVLGRPFFFQEGLLSLLRRESPDVILCEAESHFIGYWTAIFYKLLFAPSTRLLLWCYYYLPGADRDRSALHALVKKIARRFFSHFVSYGSFGKSALEARGIPPERVTVALNVCDTASFRERHRAFAVTSAEAKALLGLSDRFVVSYIGTLDAAKKPLLVLDTAERLRGSPIHFVIAGGGPMESEVREQIAARKLDNVTFAGRVEIGIERYYRASDLVIVPGRGGIVISEALCFDVPVVAHQADGVEVDLLGKAECGVLVTSADASTFSQALLELYRRPDEIARMQANAARAIDNTYNTEAMARSVIEAIRTATR